MELKAVSIPDNCIRVKITRYTSGENLKFSVRLHFEFSLDDNTNIDTDFPLVRPEQLEIVFQQLKGWTTILSGDTYMVYERVAR